MLTDELFQKAIALDAAGRLDEAEGLCRQIIASTPHHSGALLLIGIVNTKRGDPTTALPFIRRSLGIAPQVALGHFYHGAALAGLGHPHEALASYSHAAEIDPALAEAHYMCGHLFLGQNRFQEALAAFDSAIAVRPDFVEAKGGRVVALAQLGRHAEVQGELDGILAKFPDLVWALTMRGKLHLECERYEQALEDCNRAISLSTPLDALINRARVFRARGRLDEAQADIDRAVGLDPNSGYALFVRGQIHCDLGRLREALADFQHVVTLTPNDPTALTNLGNTLCALGQLDEALVAYNRAIAVDANFAKAYAGRGEVWRRLIRDELAFADFERAAELEPALAPEASMRLHLANMLCDWRDRAVWIDSVVQRIQKGEQVSPWITFSILDDPDLHLLAARRMAEAPAEQAVVRRNSAHDRLKIAYLSPDFREHVLASQIVELIEHHDKARFEVFGISLVDWPPSVTLNRLSKAFEHFVEAGSRDDRGIAELLASLEIDIVIDLAGYTDRHRAKIFTYRPAPLAVSYLGYPGSTGSENIDYVLADTVAISQEDEKHFSERVVRLPECFFPSDTGIPLIATGSRAEFGLPETGFVFCAFNNAYKISPPMFDVWMRLLQAVDGGVLWLKVGNDAARANLQREARARGVDPERLIFAPLEHFRLRHFARLRFADLYLDCVPYNAHSTATDMLLAGVPLLTCLGRSFAARVAGSMLTSLEMPELIARDLAEYESIALDLARSPERLAGVREKLARNRKTSPLFDMTRLARQIEAAYEMMWKRHLEGAEPEGFTVPRLCPGLRIHALAAHDENDPANALIQAKEIASG